MTRRAENRILQKEDKRRCLVCDEVKYLSEFSVERRNLSGRGARCTVCERIRSSALQRTPRQRVKAQQRERHLVKVDPTFAVTKRVRRAIRHLIGTSKFRGSTRYLPYSAEELKKHLESKFLPGMSWDNQQEWHIDHIKPLAAFNRTELANPTSKTFQEAWALANLQPLWQSDNCSKGAKY